jgi:hypothetical protein
MKKKTEKLTLSKETLRSLDQDSLAAVAAGASQRICPLSYAGGSCDGTCGSCFC